MKENQKKEQAFLDFKFQKKKIKMLNQEIRYICECGKNYDNFSAIYLHFQRKHKIKISLKQLESKFSIEKEGQRILITYRIEENRKNAIDPIIFEEKQIQDKLSNVFERFIAELRREEQEENVCQVKELLDKFKAYYLKERKQLKDLNQIPYYFNGFILEQVKYDKNEYRYEKICQIFMKLIKWMQENEVTELLIEYVGFPANFFKKH